jgi:hypothetical protein
MGRKPYRRSELIEKLQALALRLGHTPAEDEANAAPDCPCHQTYVNRFGSWNAALSAAGLPLNRQAALYDREMLLRILRRLADELGRTPTRADLEERDLPGVKTFARHLGSWRKALAAVGLKPRFGGQRYHREELLGVLRDLADDLGRPPTQADLTRRHGLPHPSTYKYHYGSWNSALLAAGLTPVHIRQRL